MDTRIVLEIDEDLRKRLSLRASAHGRTLEEEAKAILQAEPELPDDDPSLPTGTRIVRLFSGSGTGFREGELEELRGDPAPAARSGE
ncbi:FitA-like ribbon-helix-helix domain-containing protein [Rhodocista pekingensis]|uniref:Antitoxin FitA-like ribbon-helix-helix domain-containing protein n=1 Tax=Rhodocista pekingensis TaxID=201185 RepID=A0ABW2KWZ1_9PROT